MKYSSKRLGKVLALGLLSMSVLSACGSAPVVPEDAFYRITPQAETSGNTALDGIVEVGRFSASGSLGNRPLLMSYRDSNEVTEYNYHFWIESPPILLQSALVSYLRLANVATQVVTPAMRVTPDYTVTGRVLRFETVRGTAPAGVVTFELALRQERTDKILVLKEYTADVAASQDRVQDGAVALEQAVNQAFHNFISDIRKTSP
ncbi:MAG: ABC transporter [Rhodospirillaceae bacterium]|nr:MAG: ABC transporter [Rhodospirillaceae bacterium]